MKILVGLASLLTIIAAPVNATEISTHILDLARGIGGQNVPVTLSKRSADGQWQRVGSAHTDSNGRVRSFGDAAKFTAGDYRLEFDMSAYPDAASKPFFPEIAVTFRVQDASSHYHVPVVVSPFGYSTYRGN
ncbi:MAG: hydroxyisourate hydrolase [Sphingomonadales bacterium]|nr:MAG: hydroxyisourate hydrolase [Sphingomonadales bacterium]